MKKINTTSVLWNMPKKIQLSKAPPRIPATLCHIELLGDEVFRIRLESPGFSWVPGDCIAVYAPNASGRSRPYSLSGAAGSADVELWVRRFPDGLVSPYLTSCEAGDVVEITPPFGWFRPGEPPESDKLYFATGTGIAPFLSAISSGCALPRELFWGLKKPLNGFEIPPDIPLTVKLSRFGDSPGRITDELSQITFTQGTHVYACGLDRMIEQVLGYFKEQGLEESHLHREVFFTEGA